MEHISTPLRVQHARTPIRANSYIADACDPRRTHIATVLAGSLRNVLAFYVVECGPMVSADSKSVATRNATWHATHRHAHTHTHAHVCTAEGEFPRCTNYPPLFGRWAESDYADCVPLRRSAERAMREKESQLRVCDGCCWQHSKRNL